MSINAVAAPIHLLERNPKSSSDDEFRLIESRLSGFITQNDMTIEVFIYRSNAERVWLLEVVDEEGTPIVWDERFATNWAALDEVKRTIEAERMGNFLSDPDGTKH